MTRLAETGHPCKCIPGLEERLQSCLLDAAEVFAILTVGAWTSYTSERWKPRVAMTTAKTRVESMVRKLRTGEFPRFFKKSSEE